MRVFLTLVVGILGIIIGGCLAATVGYQLAGLGGMSDFEGGRGMFAVFFLGPIGACLGLLLGCFVGWKLGKPPISSDRIVALLILCVGTIGLVCAVVSMG